MKTMHFIIACCFLAITSIVSADPPIVPEARRLGKEAYIYLSPMVENYQFIYHHSFHPGSASYRGEPNAIHHVTKLHSARDRDVATPNLDILPSYLTMDLRTEPLVVTLPPVEPERYYALQVVDLNTHNAAYLGTREDGNGGGDFLIAGPGWKGETPPGIKRAVHAETAFVFSQFRTQLRDAADMENVKRIQAGYQVRPLSAYLKQPTPPAAPAVEFLPITHTDKEAKLWTYVNFLLQFCPIPPEQQATFDDFARIGIKAGAPWPPADLAPELVAAIEEGHAEGRKKVEQVAAKTRSTRGLYGSRHDMGMRFMDRAIAAKIALYGHDDREVLQPTFQADAHGEPLDGSQHSYVLTFPPDRVPPVRALWSLTMYDGVGGYLVENPLQRHVIASHMLPGLKKNPDGGITLYLQHQSPGPDKESNWLPAPRGPMFLTMRLYLPEEKAVNGSWFSPPILRVAAN